MPKPMDPMWEYGQPIDLSCQETWGQGRVRGRHFLKNDTWVRRGTMYIYIYAIVSSYMHIDFFINYES